MSTSMDSASLEADAAPKPPRSTIEQTADQGQSDQEQTHVTRQILQDTQPPTSDWKFKNFLLTLAREITENEFEEMKYIFSGGTDGIAHGLLSKLKTPLQFFTTLEQRRWVTSDNLLNLQSALKRINRMDLVKIAATYAHSIDNVLHFYPAPDQLENGYRSVKFHIRGRNYQSANRNDIQLARTSIAELIFAAPEDVIIVGIEPSTSLILTLLVPEPYAELLKDLLETHGDQSRFKDLGIDLIEIQNVEQLFHIKETEKAITTVREEHKKLYNIYQQLDKTKKQLEICEIEQVDLQSRIKEYEQKSFEREVLLKTMEAKLVASTDGSESPTSMSNDLLEFEKQLQRPELGSYDKGLILSLIDINTKVVSNALSEGYKLMEGKMKLAIKELEATIQPLQFELLKLRAFSGPLMDENMILEMFRKLLESISVTRQVTVEITADFLQILKKISRCMRSRERAKLAKKYEWISDEPLKQAMDNDSSFCLAAILHKEIQKTNTLVDAEIFISQCLDEVGRPDLKIKFQGLVSSKKTAQKMQHKRDRQRSKSLERDEDTDVRMSSDQIQKMAAQVAQMHDIIVTAHESIQRPSYPGFPPSSKRCSFESMDGDRFCLECRQYNEHHLLFVYPNPYCVRKPNKTIKRYQSGWSSMTSLFATFCVTFIHWYISTCMGLLYTFNDKLYNFCRKGQNLRRVYARIKLTLNFP